MKQVLDVYLMYSKKEITSKETPDISIALQVTSSSSLSGVDTRNSGSQLFRLSNAKKKKTFNEKEDKNLHPSL